MSSAVLSVPSAAQSGSLLWFVRALVVVLIYLAFMGLLFTLLLCWAAHKRSRAPKVDIKELKQQHAKTTEEFDKVIATLTVINEGIMQRCQQAAEWNQHFEDVDTHIKTITQEDLMRGAWCKNAGQRSLAKA